MPHERMFHHAHAHKLDDPERRTWLPPDEVMARLGVAAGMHVADVGCGSGYFTLPLAAAVGATGRVAAVDVQPEMLDRLRGKLPPDVAHVDLVRGDAVATGLAPSSQDLVFLANVWHELDDRDAVLVEAARLVRAGGRIAILDWRPDVDVPPGPPREHRIAAADVAASLARAGWRVLADGTVGRYAYLVVAQR